MVRFMPYFVVSSVLSHFYHCPLQLTIPESMHLVIIEFIKHIVLCGSKFKVLVLMVRSEWCISEGLVVMVYEWRGGLLVRQARRKLVLIV